MDEKEKNPINFLFKWLLKFYRGECKYYDKLKENNGTNELNKNRKMTHRDFFFF